MLSTLHWLRLALTRGLGPTLTARLVALAGSVEAACEATAALLREVDGIGPAKAESIAASLRQSAAAADEEQARAEAAGAAIVSSADAAYPPLLRHIPDPPTVLYVRGTIEPRDVHSIGIVGSRKCSIYGREQAERFATLLAGAGCVVASGGARGIDSCAHRGALKVPGGRTIAVLGSGVDVAYPPENRALFDEIAGGGGAVVSEYPMGARPAAENFPRRNRIISGISRGVIVVEADEQSGALITARQACDDHGRPVFAVPGRVDNPLSQGPHQLIRDGAVLCARVEDVLDNLGPLPAELYQPTEFGASQSDAPERQILTPPTMSGDASAAGQQRPIPMPELPDRQQLVFDTLGTEPRNVDQIVDATTLPPHIVLQELTFLSLRGLVTRVDGQTYVRRNRGS